MHGMEYGGIALPRFMLITDYIIPTFKKKLVTGFIKLAIEMGKKYHAMPSNRLQKRTKK